MRLIITAVSSMAFAALAACTTVNNSPAPATSAAPAPTTKTITRRQSPPAAQPTAPAPAPTSAGVPNVTDPWAVVSAYYGDIESGNLREAWALLSSGMVTGQTYQQFVSGFSCTGDQLLTKLGESGDQVRFRLAARDNCTGTVQYFSGTDTVLNGKIIAAHVTRTG